MLATYTPQWCRKMVQYGGLQGHAFCGLKAFMGEITSLDCAPKLWGEGLQPIKLHPPPPPPPPSFLCPPLHLDLWIHSVLSWTYTIAMEQTILFHVFTENIYNRINKILHWKLLWCIVHNRKLEPKISCILMLVYSSQVHVFKEHQVHSVKNHNKTSRWQHII